MATAALLAILFLSLWEQSDGEPGLTLLRAESSVWNATLCAVYNKDWGSVPSGSRPSSWFRAEEASDWLACSPLNLSQVGGAVVSLRGNCSFCEKAGYVESAGARLLVVVYNESDLLVEPVCDSGDRTPSIPVLLVSNDSGWDILHSLSAANLSLGPFTPPPTTFDPSAIVTLLIAVVTVVLGSYIANSPFKFLRYGLLVREGESYGTRVEDERKEGEGGVKVVAMTLLSILGFLALICVVLLLLYYFYYPMVYIVMAVYCIGACLGLFSLLSPFVALLPVFKNIRLPENRVPVLEYRPDPRFPATLLFCLAITVWWVVERHSDYGWILQDLLGFAFLVHILKRMLFLPTWVVAVAMVFLFFYDIFMVFITPFITEDHQSVMVKAATGGGGSKNIEPIPIVFVVPKLLPSALDKACPATLTGSLPYSLLGYGDVGVPGLLVALSLQFDTSWRPACKFWPYFTVASVAYCVGLGCTYVALFLTEMAQPALLYLVPTTLGSVAVLALCRREFRLFFTGKTRAAEGRAGTKSGCVQANSVAVDTDTDISEGEKETLIDKNSS